MLIAPKEVLLARLRKRTKNPYRKKDDKLKQILSDLKNTEHLLRKKSTYEIDTDIPVECVIKKLLYEV